MLPLLKKPSAWIPIAMPLLFLAIMLIRLPLYGIPAPEADEGTLAHLFQIWIVVQAVMVPFFIIKYFPREPKKTLYIFTLQLIASLLVLVPVYLLKL